MRFGDRLDVAYAIDPAAEACLVPAFLLQPIVENAFRHGIGAKAGRCRLELGAAHDRRTPARAPCATTARACRPASISHGDAGTGLSNIRTRLQNLYGGPASLSVAAAPGGGTLVTLDLPPEPPADLAPSLGMTGFRVLVVDDEPLARGMVGAIVQADPDVASVVECGDARQVLGLIAEHRPHILFLDIEMPEMSGIGVAEMVDDAGPAIVFVTAFSQYATRAFDVKAIDYVLKPFSDDRLRDALERAKRRIRERRLGELAHELSSLSANLPDRAAPAADGGAKSYLQRLAFKVGDRSVVLKTSRDPLDRGRGLLRAAPHGARPSPGPRVDGVARSGARSGRLRARASRRDRQPGRGAGAGHEGRQLPAPGRRHTRPGEPLAPPPRRSSDRRPRLTPLR